MNPHDQQANNVFELATRLPHAMQGPQLPKQADPLSELFPTEDPDLVRLAFTQFLQDQTSEIPRVATRLTDLLPQRRPTKEAPLTLVGKVKISLEDLKNNKYRREAFLGAVASLGARVATPMLRSVPHQKP